MRSFMAARKLSLLALIIVHICYIVIGTNLTQGTAGNQLLCSVRYDLAVGAGKEAHKAKTCKDVYEIYELCDADLRVVYYDIPPYIFTLPNGRVDGIIPALFNITTRICCSMCTRISYTGPMKSVRELGKALQNASIMLPTLAASTSNVYFNKPFVKLIHTPGVVYLQIDKSSETVVHRTLSSIAKTWPLLVITLLLTAQGGVIMWILDQRKNPEEFPRSFFRGAIEGSWWAYVSMTTVGYGDKAPRSFQGRIFAVFWITIGIAITGMFTASLSSSLTSAALPEKTSLVGLTVATYCLFMQIKVAIGIIGSFSIGLISRTNFKDVESLIEALRNENIDGILMDSLVFYYNLKKFKASGLDLQQETDVKNSDTSIGMMFASQSFAKWANFVNQFFIENKDAEDRIIKDAVLEMKTRFSMNGSLIDSNQVLIPNRAYASIIYVVLISTAVSFCLCTVFEVVRRKHFTRQQQRKLTDGHHLEMQKGHKDFTELHEQLSRTVDALQACITHTKLELVKLQTSGNIV